MRFVTRMQVSKDSFTFLVFMINLQMIYYILSHSIIFESLHFVVRINFDC